PAAGFGGLAIVLAAISDPDRPRGWIWSAVAAIVAIWSKQTMVPTWLALALASALCGRRSLGWFLAGSIVATAAFAGALALLGDSRNFYYNCLWIPAHHPWNTSAYRFVFGEPAPGQGIALRGRVMADAFLLL